MERRVRDILDTRNGDQGRVRPAREFKPRGGQQPVPERKGI
jgi:hypothetical protein